MGAGFFMCQKTAMGQCARGSVHGGATTACEGAGHCLEASEGTPAGGRPLMTGTGAVYCDMTESACVRPRECAKLGHCSGLEPMTVREREEQVLAPKRKVVAEKLAEYEKRLEHDPVQKPSYYTSGGIECIDALESSLGGAGFRAFCKGNAQKYLWRAGAKGDEIEDIKKAKWYLDMLLHSLGAGPDPRSSR